MDNAFFDYCTFCIDIRHAIAMIATELIKKGLVHVQIKGI